MQFGPAQTMALNGQITPLQRNFSKRDAVLLVEKDIKKHIKNVDSLRDERGQVSVSASFKVHGFVQPTDAERDLKTSKKEVESLLDEQTQLQKDVDNLTADFNGRFQLQLDFHRKLQVENQASVRKIQVENQTSVRKLQVENQATVQKLQSENQATQCAYGKKEKEAARMRTEVDHLSAAKKGLENDVERLQKELLVSEGKVALHPLIVQEKIADLTQKDVSAQRTIARLTEEQETHYQSLRKARDYEKAVVQDEMQALKDSLKESKGHLQETLADKKKLTQQYVALSRGHPVQTPPPIVQRRAEQEEDEVGDCDIPLQPEGFLLYLESVDVALLLDYHAMDTLRRSGHSPLLLNNLSNLVLYHREAYELLVDELKGLRRPLELCV